MLSGIGLITIGAREMVSCDFEGKLKSNVEISVNDIDVAKTVFTGS